MTSYSLAAIADRWRQYGRSRAVHPTLWDGSLVLATLGPQTTSERTTCRDYSGRNNHGTLTGATHLPTWSNQSYRGQSFRSLTLDGTEDYVQHGKTASQILQTTPCTFAVWLYCTTLGSQPVIASNWLNSAGNNGWQWVKEDTNKIRFSMVNADATNYWGAYGASTISANTWTHVAVTYGGGGRTGVQIYLNGVAESMSTAISGSGDPGVLDWRPFTIGRRDYPGSEQYWPGSLADFRIYNRVLTPAEISTLALGPLEAYAVRLPKYFTFTSTPSAAKYWMWARQQRSQVIGGGIT